MANDDTDDNEEDDTVAGGKKKTDKLKTKKKASVETTKIVNQQLRIHRREEGHAFLLVGLIREQKILPQIIIVITMIPDQQIPQTFPVMLRMDHLDFQKPRNP
jgi:hypothetical protein